MRNHILIINKLSYEIIDKISHGKRKIKKANTRMRMMQVTILPFQK